MLSNLTPSLRSPRIRTYLIVGGVTFLTEYVSFAAFYYVIFQFQGNVNLIVSQVVSFCLAMAVNFYGNKMFTFAKNTQKSDRYTTPVQGILYVLLAVANLGITSVLIYTLVNVVALQPLLAKLIVMLSILLWNFVIYEKIIFSKRSS